MQLLRGRRQFCELVLEGSSVRIDLLGFAIVHTKERLEWNSDLRVSEWKADMRGRIEQARQALQDDKSTWNMARPPYGLTQTLKVRADVAMYITCLHCVPSLCVTCVQDGARIVRELKDRQVNDLQQTCFGELEPSVAADWVTSRPLEDFTLGEVEYVAGCTLRMLGQLGEGVTDFVLHFIREETPPALYGVYASEQLGAIATAAGRSAADGITLKEFAEGMVEARKKLQVLAVDDAISKSQLNEIAIRLSRTNVEKQVTDIMPYFLSQRMGSVAGVAGGSERVDKLKRLIRQRQAAAITAAFLDGLEKLRLSSLLSAAGDSMPGDLQRLKVDVDKADVIYISRMQDSNRSVQILESLEMHSLEFLRECGSYSDLRNWLAKYTDDEGAFTKLINHVTSLLQVCSLSSSRSDTLYVF